MIGAAGVGKTAFFLYPNLEYYGYQVSIIDLRNPTRSDGFNFLTLANAYMDQAVERRHIVSVFKLVQDLLEPSKVKGKSCFQVLMSRLPSEHKARWFAGAALNTSDGAAAQKQPPTLPMSGVL